jgi:sugar/nucleoside kinase (ribokinase family)
MSGIRTLNDTFHSWPRAVGCLLQPQFQRQRHALVERHFGARAEQHPLLAGGIAIARANLAQGPALVVITRGAAGLVGVTEDKVVEVPGVATTVIDTVGAGDTVGAVLVEGIVAHGLAGLCGGRLPDVLERAAHAAAITCSRAGAQPPCAAELPS